MDFVSTATTLVTTVGFPIACCITLFWYVKRLDERKNEEQATINERHYTEMQGFRSSLDSNTLILTKLYEMLMNEKRGN